MHAQRAQHCASTGGQLLVASYGRGRAQATAAADLRSCKATKTQKLTCAMGSLMSLPVLLPMISHL